MKNVIAAGLLAAAVLLSVVLQVRLLHPTAGLAQLLWDDDEAFLFIEEAVSGWRMSYAEFGAALAMTALGHDPAVHSRKMTYNVIRVTANSEEIHSLRMVPPSVVRPLRHNVYTLIDDLPMRWNGSRFESANFDEWSELASEEIPLADYSNLHGWSNRSNIIGRHEGETRYWLHLSGVAVDVIAVVYVQEGIFAVDIQRDGSPRRRIWSLNSNYKCVGQAEYEATFR